MFVRIPRSSKTFHQRLHKAPQWPHISMCPMILHSNPDHLYLPWPRGRHLAHLLATCLRTSLCRKIHIYHSFSANRTPDLSLSVSKRGCRHNIGAMAWGCDSTSPHLFASTEPSGQGRDGFHKAFDVSHQQCLYEFNADEAGDALGLDPNGKFVIHPIKKPLIS